MAIKVGETVYSSTYSTNNTYTKYRIGVKANSRNLTANKWNITVTVDAWRTNSGYTSNGTGTLKCIIGGTSYSEKITTSKNITQNSHTILFSKTLDVSAASDGNLSLVIAAQITLTAGSFGSSENKYTFTFEQIPKTSILSLSTNSFFIGENVTIKTNRASSSFAHKLYYSMGNSGYKLLSDSVGVSYNWIPTSEIAKYITTDIKGKGKLILETYSYGTKLGTSTVEIEIKIPNTTEYYPSINSINYEDTNEEVKEKFNKILKTISALKVNISATGVYGSTISSYKTLVNNETYNTSEFTTSKIKTKDTSIIVSVTDSRGRVTNKELNLDIVDYDFPVIREFSAIRNNEDSSLVDLYLDGKVCDIDNQNNVEGFFYYKEKQSDSNYNNIAYHFDTYDIKSAFQVNLDSDKSYDIYFVLSDTLSSTSSKELPISTAFRLINFNKSGKSFALGKLSEISDGIEIDIPFYILKEIYLGEGNDSINLLSTLNNLEDRVKKIEEVYKNE